MKRIILNIGEFAVSKEPAVLETILGSCVAVCLWDSVNSIGGLNHYLLPREQAGAAKSTVYGATSIDAMVEEIIGIGADADNLQAQIFGGGSVIEALDDIFNIGMENVRIAREKMFEYGISIVGEHVRGRHGIRVVFKTNTGEVVTRPLGEQSGGISKAENAAIRQVMKPCKECIMCGSCAELLRRRKNGNRQ
jgi:chemotaxis protein CheD